jgi:hypothetical protein
MFVYILAENIMSTNSYAESLISEKQQEIETLEKEHLGWWSRLKRRWTSREVIIAWNVSSWFTFGQVLLGKKFFAWFGSTFPSVVSFFSKLWGAVVATFVGVLEFATPL